MAVDEAQGDGGDENMDTDEQGRPQTEAESEAALKLWGAVEQRTSAQARELCEQLRLVLGNGAVALVVCVVCMWGVCLPSE